jgi:hypothetical protein
LRRGIYLRHDVPAGHVVTSEDIYFAFPPQDNQFTANDWSKYAVFTTTQGIGQNQPLAPVNSRVVNTRDKILEIAQKVTRMIHDAKIIPPGKTDLEISHHHGLENFDQTGLTMLTLVNRGYCKKLLISLPGQSHPEQYHQMKDETFHVLFGEVEICLNGEKRSCKPGDVVNIEPGVRHSFYTASGCIIEEISSTHFKDDSFYTDPRIAQNKSRKTLLTYWMG